MNTFDVIVVGAGFAGCSAAVNLARRGNRVALMEAGGRLGGRAGSFLDSQHGTDVDLGQHVLLRAYDSTIDLLETIGTVDQVYFNSNSHLTFWDAQTKSSRVLRIQHLPAPLHLAAGLSTYAHVSVFDRVRALWGCRRILGLTSVPVELDHVPLGEWLSNELGQPASVIRAFWEPIVLATLNIPVECASTYLFLNVLRHGFMTDPRKAQIGYSKVPLRQLLDPAVEEFLNQHGCQVYRRHQVKSIRRRTDECQQWVVTTDRQEFLATKKVIVALNLPSLFHVLQLEGRPPESESITSFHFWMEDEWVWPWGKQIQVGLLGTKLQWLFFPANIPGSRFSPKYVTGTYSASGRLSPDVSSKELKDMILDELRKVHPEMTRVREVKALTEKWATFSAATGFLDTRQKLLKKLQRDGLCIAGDWTHPFFPSTIEAACQTGKLAAEFAEIDRSVSHERLH